MILFCRRLGATLVLFLTFCAFSKATLSTAPTPRVPFLANEGQLPDDTVAFVARTFGGLVAVHNDGMLTYNLPRLERAAASTPDVHKHTGTQLIREKLEAALPIKPAGADKRAMTTSFFKGSDPQAWRTAVAAYDTVDLGEVYNGITMKLRAKANNVEKIFTVAPGADPNAIRMRFEGADAARLMPDGSLQLDTALGPVSFSAPVAFQEINDRCEPVTVAYALDGNSYGFALGAYDPEMPLVIDPLLQSTFIGGSGDDVALAITGDPYGNVYAAGYTASMDFPMTNSCGTTHGGMWDAFVVKFDETLSELIAGAYLGGSKDDAAMALAVSNELVVVAGFSESDDYPVTIGAAYPERQGARDAIISVLNADLTMLLGSTYLGGTNDDTAYAVGLDSAGLIQVAGQTASDNFPLAGNPLQMLLKGNSDAFVCRLNTDLSILMASTYIGGDLDDAAYAMTIMPKVVALAGRTWSGNFPLGTNVSYKSTLSGASDAFLMRMPMELTNIIAGTYLGGDGDESACAIIADTGVRIRGVNTTIVTSLFVTGFTDSGNFPTNNTIFGGRTFGISRNGPQDAFIARFPEKCDTIYAGSYLGGFGAEVGTAIALDPTGYYTNDVIVAGYTDSDDFPTTYNSYSREYNGMSDGFIIRLQQSLTNENLGATYLGGADDDYIHAITRVDSAVYVAGSSRSANYPVNDSAFDITYRGSNDVVISRMAASLSAGTLRWRGYTPAGQCHPVATDIQGNIYAYAALHTKDGYLYKFSPEGKTNWYISVPGSGVDTLGGIDICPVVDLTGNIYLSSGGNTRLLGYNTNGVRFLNFSLGGTFIKTKPSIKSDGNILQAHWMGEPTSLFCIRPYDGFLVQRIGVTNAGINSAVAIASNGWFYHATDAHGMMGYKPDGVRSWTENIGINMSSTPSIDDAGNVYVGGKAGNLYQFRADSGIQDWTFTTAGAAIISGSPVILSNGSIAVMTATNVIVVKSDGTLQWGSRGMENDHYMSPAVGDEGSLFVPSSNVMYALRQMDTGVFLTNWIFTAPFTGRLASPCIALDGTIYVGGASNVYAVFGTESLAQTPWPMAHHDPFRSGNQGLNPVPAVPQNLQASKGDPWDRIAVTWDFALNASRYELYRGTNDSLEAATNLLVVMRGNVFYDSAVVPGRRYYYRVLAKNVFGDSEMSESDYGGTPPLPPDKVLASKGVPLDRIRTSWSRADYADVYQLWRSTNSSVNLATNLLAVSSGTGFVDAAITLGVRYYYFTKSTNEFGASIFSESDYGGTAPIAYPPKASDGVSFEGINVGWPFSAGAEAFELWRSIYDIPVTATRIASVAATNFFDMDIVPSNVVPCRRYYYWVKTTNEFGASAFSASDSGWRALTAPTELRASDGGVYTTKVHTAWTPVPYALTYELYRGITPNFDQAMYLNRVGGLDFNDTTITRGGTYYYWLRAWNDYGNSTWIGPDAGGTPTLAPSGITATKGAFMDRISVNWQQTYGASGYQLLRSTSIDPGFASILLATTGTAYEDRATIPGQRYYYWARATNTFGISSLSPSDVGYVTLSPPNGIVASDGTFTNRVNIIWNEAPGASTYEVYRNTHNDAETATRLVYTAERSFDDTLVTPGVLYYYWIRSKTASFNSGFSQPDTGYAASGLADLQVRDFVFLPTSMGLYTTPDAVSFRLRNAGPQPLFGGDRRVSIDLYLSRNPVFGDGDDVWVGRTTQDIDLPVGAEKLINLNANQRMRLEIPYVDTGSYYVFLLARHSYPSSYLDPNMADNVARKPYMTSIQAFAPSLYTGINDYDGDGRSDLAVYDSNTGQWYIKNLDDQILVWGENWGGPGFIPLLGDFDGDRKADLAVYSSLTGHWYIRSLDGTILSWATPWGGPGFVPIWGDYDGDGSVDLAVYQEATGLWFVRTVAGDLLAWAVPWGGQGYVPVMGDYNGDGCQDFAVFHKPSWNWFARTLTGEILIWADQWGGATGFIPVSGDYDGDGESDLAVYHPATGYWFIKNSHGNVLAWGEFWGGLNMHPVPGDYDGDGRDDLAIYNLNNGAWYIRSLNGTIIAWDVRWGGGAMRPVGMGE